MMPYAHAPARTFVSKTCSFRHDTNVDLATLPTGTRRRTRLNATAYAPPDNTLVLTQGSTTTQIPLSTPQLLEVKHALAAIIKVFAEKAAYDADGRQSPQRWESVDVCVQEEREGNNVRVEVFCNPNSCMNAFEAKVLVTVRDCTSGLRVVTEVGLEELKSAYKVVVEDM